MYIQGLSVASKVVSVVPIKLVSLSGYFAGAADAYLQIHDAKALPADTAVPAKSFLLQAQFAYDIPLGDGLNLENGCVVVVSSTKDTLTLLNAADKRIDVQAVYNLACLWGEDAAVIAPVATTDQAGQARVVVYTHESVKKRLTEVILGTALGIDIWLHVSTDTQDHYAKIPAGEVRACFGKETILPSLNITVDVFEDEDRGTPTTNLEGTLIGAVVLSS